jgi:AraC-like DNA-binding protein
MKHQFHKPSPELQHLICQYLVLQTDQEDFSFEDKFVPDGYAAMVFNFNSRQVSIHTDKADVLPDFFIVIPKIQPLKIEVSIPAESLIVLCKASVLSRVFDVKFNKDSEAPHREIDLFCGFPMFEELSRIQAMSERIAFFEKYLLDHFDINKYVPDEIDRLYLKVIGSEENFSVSELLSSVKVNSRTFRRKFLERVGINLKGLIRIVRVNHVCKILSSNKTNDLQFAVFIGNFYDQAHLTHDFKKIVGETPKVFFSSNLKDVKTISGNGIS